MAWPTGGEAVLSGDVVGARKVHAVSLLGTPAELSFNQQANGLHINAPAEAAGNMPLCCGLVSKT
jgi:hypothetical protein